MNVVLVIFDSLRKDCLGIHGPAPWGEVRTPHLDALASESLVFDRAYPESLPTLPTRRAIYTGRRVYPFEGGDFRLKGDFVGAAGWGPIPEEIPTLAETLKAAGYRTGLIADLYHMFKPSKNFWRGFDQWMFLRGQETDPMRSGPEITREELDRWLPPAMQTEQRVAFLRQCLKNMHGRTREEDYFNARVMIEAARWLEQNRDAEGFFLTVESFDPHEPWFVPEHYRRMYAGPEVPQQVVSGYTRASEMMTPELIAGTRANYSALCTMCDRWFGHLYETMRVLDLLEDTLLIVTSDHGHSIGEGDYLGKRAYPSAPSVLDVPLIVRHPEGLGAGRRSEAIVQHTDITAQILQSAGVQPPGRLDGMSFIDRALEDGGTVREHVTVGWGAAITVVDAEWWLNCKVDGKGAFLHKVTDGKPGGANVAEDNPEVVDSLYRLGVEDAGGDFPDYVKKMALEAEDAPGCSALAARPA
ncbi:MAG: sulfatase [Candidatus Brocadiia bacterium]|nr:sulfatase [Candidatus Brocadiia bacterium]